MKIGVYYYPEQWPRDQWKRDFDNIAAMGLQIVHMAEFAWFTMEPREGDIQLDWLEECVEMARARKLDVILCTPTAVPPVWLVEKYPEILIRREDGSAIRHGGRRHASPTSPAFRDATTRIVTALAERFGKHPSVIGWQIDNEYSGPFDQNEHTHAAFRAWLQTRYQSIDNLNRAWGCQFWNTFYTKWKQVMFPPSRDPGYGNPHQHLDASRFWSWAYADFNALQAGILKKALRHEGTEARREGGPGEVVGAQSTSLPFITTNFMPFHLDCNPENMLDDLTLFSWDSYPVTGWEKGIKDETYRIADPNGIGIVHDLMRSYRDRWALMEVQPGQVNWTGTPVLPYPGAVRLWLWTAYAHGAEFVTVYRFRQPRWGIELFHHGLMNHDGVTQSPGGRQFVQVIKEIHGLGVGGAEAVKPKKESRVPTHGNSPLTPRAAILFDFDQLWWFKTLPQAKRWDQGRFLKLWYGALMRLGFDVQVLRPGSKIPDGLSMLIAPGLQMVDDALIKQLDDYASSGGNLVLTCRTGLMDRNGIVFEGPTAAPILPLIGALVEAYDGLPDGVHGKLEMDGKQYDWGVWGDLLYSDEGTRVLAKYSDQFYRGAIAVTQKRHGKGLVTYCGVYSERAFIDALIEKLAREAGVVGKPFPDRVHVLKRDGFTICLNYQDKQVAAPVPKGAKFIIGGKTIEPAGVAVWVDSG